MNANKPFLYQMGPIVGHGKRRLARLCVNLALTSIGNLWSTDCSGGHKAKK